MKSIVTLKDGMNFDTELDGHHFDIDAAEQFGGRDIGPSPKGLVLSALCGCTAMDVISILRKMKTIPDTFSVEAEAELTEHHPKVFSQIKMVYRFTGDSLNEKNIHKAINLSQDNYCGVSAMLKKVCPIDYIVEINI